ncbi:MAG: hypothetical protein AMXMBFR13_35270 [Phycisphaerae bacterium]
MAAAPPTRAPAPAAAPASAATEAKVPAAPGPVPQPEGANPVEEMRQTAMAAAAEAKMTGQLQIRYDEDNGLVYFVGPAHEVEAWKRVMEDVAASLEELEGDLLTASDIRVFEMQYVDVNVAAAILEEMFNDKQAAQPAAPKAPQANRRGGAAAKPGTPGQEDDESSAAQRRREEEEQQAKEAEEATKAARGGQRIRVFADARTRTVIVRAAQEDFPSIAELVLKIDRPGEAHTSEIRVFQLKKLNAYDVEVALKSVLKIQDPSIRAGMFPARAGFRGRGAGGVAGGNAEAMIEQLEQQMLQLQMQTAVAAQGQPGAEPGAEGEGKQLKLNPSRDISLTSEATTNSILVTAPKEGIQIVQDLIEKLEDQTIPLRIETFPIRHGDAQQVATQLEKLFQGSGGGSSFGGRGGFAGSFTGVESARSGEIRISADSRTNTILVRALEPDMEKIRPIIAEIDKSEGGQVQLYTIENGSAADLATTLSRIYSEGDARGGSGRAIRITADANTNTLIVSAPEFQQKLIAEKIREIDKRASEVHSPRRIKLEFASATAVADTLDEIFGGRATGGRGSRGRGSISITGDDNSGIIFVVAPEELFKQIEAQALILDQPGKVDTRVYKLTYAFATEIITAFKDVATQTLQQAKKGTNEVLAATPDPRTNSLIVTGTAAAHLAVEKVLKDLDVQPSDTSQPTTAMFGLTKSAATAVAASINQLFTRQKFPGGVAAPTAVAEPSSNVVFVYGTKSQMETIKSAIIDPLEDYKGVTSDLIKEYQIPVKYANVEEVAALLNNYFTMRSTGFQKGGLPAQSATELVVTIVPDPIGRQLLVNTGEANKKLIDDLLVKYDTPEASGAGRQIRVFPLTFADPSYATQAINQMFTRSQKVAESEMVVATAEHATQSLIVRANGENMKKVEELIQSLDKGNVGQESQLETLKVQNMKASELATMLTNLIRTKYRPSRGTGLLPISVTGNDSTNTLVISASAKNMEDMKGLITQLDTRPADVDEQRFVKPYIVKFADMATVASVITQRFAPNQTRGPRDQVLVTPEYATGSILVTASPENHEKVADLLRTVDVGNIEGMILPETVRVRHVKATELANQLSVMIRNTKRPDRSRGGVYPVTVTGNDTTNTLVITAASKDMEEMKALIAKLDIQPAGGEERSVQPYPVQFVDLATVVGLINTTYMANASRPLYDQVTAAPEYATSSILVTASPENHAKIQELIDKVDVENVAGKIDQKMIRVRHVKATTLANQLTNMIRVTYRIDRTRGTYPITVTGDDVTQTLLVTGSQRHMEDIESLIKEYDVAVDSADERLVKPYPVQFADLGSVVTVITQSFAANTSRPVLEQVTAAPEYGTSTIVVTASPDNHAKVQSLIEQLDRPDFAGRKTHRAIRLEHARASEVATTLNNALRATGMVNRSRGTMTATVQPNDATNVLLVTASEQEFKDIETLIKVLDVKPGADTERVLRPYPIKYAELYSVVNAINSAFAQTAASKSIRDQVSAVAEPGTLSAIVMATEENHRKVEELIAQVDRVDTGRKTIPVEIKHADPEDVAASLTEIFSATRATTARGRLPASFTVPRGSRKIMVSSTPTEFEEIQKLIEQLDVQSDTSTRDTRVVKVQHITPDEMTNILTEFMRRPGASQRYNPQLLGDVKIMTSASAGAVVITGPKDRLDELEALAQKVDEAAPAPEDKARMPQVFTLKYADPSSVASVITQSFAKYGQVPEAERVTAVAEWTTSSVVVTANPDKLKEIGEMIERVDKEGNASQREIIPLKLARAEDLATVLRQTVTTGRRRQGEQPLVIAPDANANALVVAGNAADIEGIKVLVEQLDKEADAQIEEMRIIPLQYIDATETLTILNEHLRKPDGSRSRSGSTLVGDIRLQASATLNAIVVGGSTLQIEKVQQLLATMDKEMPGMGTAPRIIQVKNASASQLAETLTRMFTETARQNRSRSSSPDMVPLILADEASNSLVVRARQVDYNLIAGMAEQLDVEVTSSGYRIVVVDPGIDAWSLAEEVENVINEGERAKARQQRGYQAGQVEIRVDPRGGAMIVGGSPSLFDTAEKMVEDLTRIRPGRTSGAVVVPVRNLTPQDVKRILDQVIQNGNGRSGTRRR